MGWIYLAILLGGFTFMVFAAHSTGHRWTYTDHGPDYVTYECERCGETKREEF
jgi:hypothetical protein